MFITVMADYNEEKGLLGPPLKSHRRYGSTSVNMKKPDHIVVHVITKSDTIQGIALKYGVTIELLKKHNKLWSSESIFLHDFLEVPVSRLVYESIIKDNPTAAQIPISSPSSSPSLTNGSSNKESDTRSITSSCSGSSSPSLIKNSSECKPPTSPNGLHDCSEKSSDDILNKIDSNIALMKSNIRKMEAYMHPMVDQMEVDDSCKKGFQHKRHASDGHPNCWGGQQRYQNGGWQDPTLPPRAIVTNPSRTITMSLKRLLRDHEELYEL